MQWTRKRQRRKPNPPHVGLSFLQLATVKIGVGQSAHSSLTMDLSEYLEKVIDGSRNGSCTLDTND